MYNFVCIERNGTQGKKQEGRPMGSFLAFFPSLGPVPLKYKISRIFVKDYFTALAMTDVFLIEQKPLKMLYNIYEKSTDKRASCF